MESVPEATDARPSRVAGSSAVQRAAPGDTVKELRQMLAGLHATGDATDAGWDDDGDVEHHGDGGDAKLQEADHLARTRPPCPRNGHGAVVEGPPFGLALLAEDDDASQPTRRGRLEGGSAERRAAPGDTLREELLVMRLGADADLADGRGRSVLDRGDARLRTMRNTGTPQDAEER
mmetsp:Transcript_103411/g.205552  ORF Transcript_103411/g.205552 Transcript_103411/m.205552 type:complete len:177 (+) Transcript_103411:48-578(+)